MASTESNGNTGYDGWGYLRGRNPAHYRNIAEYTTTDICWNDLRELSHQTPPHPTGTTVPPPQTITTLYTSGDENNPDAPPSTALVRAPSGTDPTPPGTALVRAPSGTDPTVGGNKKKSKNTRRRKQKRNSKNTRRRKQQSQTKNKRKRKQRTQTKSKRGNMQKRK